ncbi:tyrosine-type recombinase/integrase [Robbsia andropogonis]|uniref:tyrosine-type recombinase/integrase n=1 Tax=Robbsia andropogonis TaxID=28092 RepID=UPI0034506619
MAISYKKELNQLSAVRVARLTAPGLYADGGGLGLLISPAGTRSWVFRFSFNGKERRMGAGSYPAVSLAMARELAGKYRAWAKQGIDPAKARNAEKAIAMPAVHEKTFSECAAEYIESQKPGWKSEKHAQQWTNTLKTYTFEKFGSLPIRAVDTDLVMSALSVIWICKNETATRVRGRIESILDWAAVKKYRSGDNPARWRGHLEHLLADPNKVTPVKHHPALPFSRMVSFFRALQKLDSMSAAALEFTILTAARTNETQGALPREFNLKKRIWTIPAERMKASREHRVPLSSRACQIAAQRIEIERREKTGYMFPGKRPGKTMSNMAMLEVLRGMKIGHYTVHGFRSSFRDWAAECTEYPNEMLEMALAHTVKNAAEAAYRRGDMFERRIPLMNEWERYCLPEQG